MNESFKIELPSRFTLPALAELKVQVGQKLDINSELILDGSAVSAVDTAALQFLLMIQHTLDSRRNHDTEDVLKDNGGATIDDPARLSVLQPSSDVLEKALQEIGASYHGASALNTAS